tara:strand:- start:256 stop:474 length:219 start_codon:yes stop_codon:yes gene_type:complete
MKIATQMPNSNNIEHRGDKIFANLIYEVTSDDGLTEHYSVYRLISEDTSLPFEALIQLAEAASSAFAAELEA